MRPGYALVVALLLTACNLQQSPPIAATLPAITEPPTAFTPAPAATRPPPGPGPPTPTPCAPGPPDPLFPTLEAILPGGPALIEGLPTLDPAAAFQRYELTARPGQTVNINFEVMIARSALTVTMQGAEGVVWRRTFEASITGTEPVTVQAGGNYDILVMVETPFDGSFSLTWD